MKNTNKTKEQLTIELETLRVASKKKEDELKAANQQLRAAKNQLEAKNQQLQASEQQLRAANQQLIASEHELKKEKNFSERIIETANAIIIGLDKDHIIRIFNKGAEDITGYTKAEVIGKDWFKIFFTKERLNEMNKVWEDAWGITFHSYVNPILSKEGKEIIVSWQTTGIYESEDVPEHLLISIGEDITERKQAEKENIKLSTAVTQSPSVIAITNKKGNLEYVNPKFTELTGYTLEEAKGENPRILKSGKQQDEMYKELWKTISSGKTWHGEFHNKKKNGELFWEAASVSPIFDKRGKIINYIKVAEDITERKRIEQVQKVIHNISNAVITTDNLNEFIVIVKDELESLIDTTNFYVALYHEETDTFDLVFHKDKIDKIETFPAGKSLTSYVVKTKKPLLATKTVIEKLEKSGKVESFGADSKIWLGVPLIIKGKVIGVFAVQSYDDEMAYDKSDMKMLKIISHQISISLERKKTEENLKSALEKAQESDRLKTSFLNTMSHELRTPLNAVIGFSSLINEEDITEDVSFFANTINNSGNHLLKIVEEIFDVSLIETGNIKVIKQKQLLNPIMQSVESMIITEQKLLKRQNIEIVFNTDSTNEKLLVNTDGNRLKQILINLLKNAMKFTHEGRIVCGYEKEIINDKGFLKFYVKDSGIGIPKEKQEIIFDAFRQVDEGNTRQYEGVGVGLNISKKLAELLGGKIWVESEVGQGSNFYFTIPCEIIEDKLMAKESKPMEKELITNTILVVEDDEPSYDLLRIILSKQNIKIIRAVNGRDAIEQCNKNENIGLILMDIRLPDINGYEATKQIKIAHPQITIIAQTADAVLGSRERAIEAGCDDYIAKPYGKTEILEVLQKHF